MYHLEDDIYVMTTKCTLKKADISYIYEFMESRDIKYTLVTSPAISRQGIDEVETNRIGFIPETLYAFDRMKSKYVPNYQRLSEDAIQDIEKRHVCKRHQFPVISVYDPIVHYLGFQRGDCLQYGVEKFIRIVV